MTEQYPETFEEAWQLLGNTPVDDNEQIDEPYLDYPAGTDIYSIWHRLEEHYDVSIGEYINRKNNER